MRFILPIALALMLSAPAMAQDDGTPVAADDVVTAETPATAPVAAPVTGDRRAELALRMHEIWPVRTRVEEAITMIAAEVPDAEREAFKSRMRNAVDYSLLEQESVAAMARSFNEKELEAMVNFYGSPEGRSISVKTQDYMKALEPIMVKMLDSAILKLRTGTPLQSTPGQAQ